ncbi:MAG: DNA translocase FtsK [Desulfonauticus sp.]|nr:DNA translocase FtsK [Desulfonauticus sp.]
MKERDIWKEVGIIFFVCLTIFIAISLFSYSPSDPSFNSSGFIGKSVHNKAGLIGAYLAGLLFDLFGLGAFLLVAFFVYLILFLKKNSTFSWWRWIFLLGLYLCLLIWLCYPFMQSLSFHSIRGGGVIGFYFYNVLNKYLQYWGGTLVLLTFTLINLQLVFNFCWSSLFEHFKIFRIKENIIFEFKKIKQKFKNKNQEKIISQKVENKNNKFSEKQNKKSNKIYKNKDTNHLLQNICLPDVSLLPEIPKQKHSITKDYLNTLSKRVKECLNNFGIDGTIETVTPGPVVSMLEFKPAPGIKVSKIANLSDDLAVHLKSSRVRIIAPLPGKNTVGIEIPNVHRQFVYFKEILESPAFNPQHQILPLALGKNIQGMPMVVDLVKMPHLLVAGATGAGKSVCLNGFLLSLLFSHTPDRLKLLLIDPKRIELSVYNELPHLVHPVVTESALAKVALEWAVSEMEQRYELMAKEGVRNIQTYNKKVLGHKEKDPFPYMVIIIDEMADLMLTGAKEVEVSIVRLAQLARAAGIHLIIATQRPSVDVVTGIIKANFPARIAFQVSSKHDSRTILDANGAEYLLGKGDMLFKSSGGELIRVHGAYVTEGEIESVVNFWKNTIQPDYLIDFKNWKKGQQEENTVNNGQYNDIVNDPKYQAAVEYAIEQGKISISLIQRRFRIGFNKAALFIEQMEKDGILGPPEGSKPRQVLIKK